MNKLPKLILTDIDGVWTDGGMYYDEMANEIKKFNTSDSAGVLYCKKLNIKVGVITGENTKIVANRCKKLGIDIIYQGSKNKLKDATEICEKLNISLNEVAYIGDDLTDYHLLKEVGFSGCPDNAQDFIKKAVSFVGKTRGGEGAFREFVEEILTRQSILQNVIQSIIDEYK